MRYSLWSHDRLVGHTELDLPCHQDRFIQGFLEPTPEAQQLLVDATGVVAVCGRRRTHGADWASTDAYLAAFTRAVERREALNFVLRDASGQTFSHDFVRIYDLFDQSWQDDDDVDCEDPEARWAQSIASEELDADLLTEMEEDWSASDDSEVYESSWQPDDARWDTMQYYIQVFLEHPDSEAEDLSSHRSSPSS